MVCYCVYLCMYTANENAYVSLVSWTPVNMTEIGGDNLNTATTLSYNVPSIIPNTAQGVLLYSIARCGTSSDVGRGGDITYYVVENEVRYEHFLLMRAYPQEAHNTNSDNMWFPMPSNRLVYVDVPIALPGNCFTTVSVIGYR